MTLLAARSGAASRTCVKSNGLATAATDATGSEPVARHGEQRHDPAQAPAEQLHGPAAGVLADRADRVGQHVADPELETEVAVGERDRPVLDEVRRVAHRDEVLGHRAAAAQVEADRRRRERRDEEHRAGRAAARRAGAGSGRRRAWAPRR